MEDVLKALIHVRNVYVDYPNKLEHAVSMLERVEDERQDLLHVIEFGRLNASELSHLNKELRNVQRERRKLKNEIEVLSEIDRFSKIKNVREHTINDTIGRVRGVIDKQNKRTYTMRVRTDLQEMIK